MNETILNNINESVNINDYLFILGDFSFLSVKQSIEQLKRINCKNIIFTQGNHDQQRFINGIKNIEGKNITSYFINNEPTFMVDKTTVHFNHIPLEQIPRYNHINLHGHIHTEDKYSITNKGYYDVGVDNNEFKPISIHKIREINNF